MQKLVTFFLDDDKKSDKKEQEHLNNYLLDGWEVISITALGGSSGHGDGEDYHASKYTAGWFAVLLNKK